MNIVFLLLNTLFPHRCVICKKITKEAVCEACYDEIRSLAVTGCKICGKLPVECICKKSALIKNNTYVYIYKSEKLVSFIYNFKNQNNIQAVNFFADRITENLRIRYKNDFTGLKYITNVPRKKNSKRRYGYDQAEKLARAVSKNINIRYRAFLEVNTNYTDQKSLPAKDRILNIKGKFRFNGFKFTQNECILLIDDVITTGSTVDECAKVLIENGAGQIDCACIASV